jgi:hypothetical protein
MLPQGITTYAIVTSPVSGCGVVFNTAEIDQALAGPVSDIVFDVPGVREVDVLLSSIAETEFDQSGIRRILNNQRTVENWRVGEALAEAYLNSHRSCQFPWPDSRDERKVGSSLPGADLIGFQSENMLDRFAFGEVKTSSEQKYPPGTMYGRTGLKQQLEDLRDSIEIRDNLVKYLCHRAPNTSWSDRFHNACKCYLADSNDVRIFGILVRDVTPNPDDMIMRVDRLNKNCPPSMKIELIALYLPAGTIEQLPDKIKHPLRRETT